MKTHFTSDTHFRHRNIIKYSMRPFVAPADQEILRAEGTWDGVWLSDKSKHSMSDESVRLMDECLIDGINRTVGRDDVLWFLGDWAFGPKHSYYDVCKSYRDRINCRTVHMIWGNHDEKSIAPLFSSAERDEIVRYAGFRFHLSHYAHAVWDKSHRDSIHLYGHSHASAEPWLDINMPGRRSMDVGVDNAYKILGEYRPFSLDEILEIMSDRPGFWTDHHDPRLRTKNRDL